MYDIMHDFRIRFTKERGQSQQAVILRAPTVGDAIERLGLVHRFHSVSIRCDEPTKSGGRCQQWTSNDVCHLHTRT